ncbi:restriction endonuclease [Vandammella animalimorsus]|uniref:Restriction endonuclease n=1 Tax=Vandammella animalimorsus TaxID=2029117 RepID=A0A2A2AEC7_9BURK|nr:restriction endonuclease [Vandammella animalimorsus]PAT33438.1 restriction endonuclease [Vandammella animalimorsus]PAT36102.1 restriction endonuclease [Vandammella animalimorsus]
MAIPDTPTIKQALLTALADGQEHRMSDVVSALEQALALTAEEASARYASSGDLKFSNMVWWARYYLKQEGLLDSPKRGVVQITPKGKAALSAGQSLAPPNQQQQQDPQEALEAVMAQLTERLRADVLERVRQISPRQFEYLVTRVLLKMGYGFDEELSGITTPYSKDGGIDGLVHEDKLGLSSIYIQAKRYSATTSVGSPEVQQFVGALTGHGASKGVFITSSDFSSGARQYADGLKNLKVVLVNGAQLARLMVEHGVGVSTSKTLCIQHVDSDFFDDGLNSV